MTEPERLIENGTFKKDFFNEEVRDEFTVSVPRKKIWAVELDLMLQFDQVCKKHGLRYFLFCGSLLGAIRHRGFVPWDDDVDVAMPRDDYERLLTLSYEFVEPYYLQIPCRDKGYFYSYSKLRNSNTSCRSINFGHRGFNQGIFIDIFILDEWENTPDGEKTFLHLLNLYKKQSSWMRSKEEINDFDNPYDVSNEIDMLQCKYRGHNTAYWALASMTLYGYSKSVFYADDFKESVLLPFEQFYFPVPCGYERILETMYGNWRKFPLPEERGRHHTGGLFDADIPYKV